MESTHLIMHPEFTSSYNLVEEKYRSGKSRNDLCLIKMEHSYDNTQSRMNKHNFPDIPCRLPEPIDMNEVILLLL